MSGVAQTLGSLSGPGTVHEQRQHGVDRAEHGPVYGGLAGGVGLHYNLAGSTVAAPSATMTYTGGTTLGGGGTFQTFADGNFGSTTSPAGIWLNDATLEVPAAASAPPAPMTLGDAEPRRSGLTAARSR